jgi:DNA repair exonuclease SbcCD nuclease subunit
MNTIRLIHLADIHLGFTGPANLILDTNENEEAAGCYVREVDIENAVESMTKTIIQEQPSVDMVVIAGDLFHKPAPYPRATNLAAQMVHKLIESKIAVVVIDGNHETASILHTGSPTTVLHELGAEVINGATYEVVRERWNHLPPEKQARLAQLAIHALPCRAVYEKQFIGAQPLPGYINVLLTHGRIAGMDELNSLHHTAPNIPKEVLRRGWDYVALGDWHIHGHQPIGDVPAFYAGSLEALNFGEAAFYPPQSRNPYALHGALDVRLAPSKPAVIESLLNQDARPVLRLEPTDATDLDANTLMDILRRRLKTELPPNALVLLEVKNCLSEVWNQLDRAEIDALRKQVRRFDIRWDILRPSLEQSQEALSGAALDSQWQRFLEQQEHNEAERSWYYEQGMKRIEEARVALLAAHAQAGE